jgi:hypothetical protein
MSQGLGSQELVPGISLIYWPMSFLPEIGNIQNKKKTLILTDPKF